MIARILYCTRCIVVIEAKTDIDFGGSILIFPKVKTMATLDEITNEKRRVSQALARVEAQREKLAGQLAELEATERVLARYYQGFWDKKDGIGEGTERGKKSGFSGASRRAATQYDHEISWPQA
jgi:hypothetical protein